MSNEFGIITGLCVVAIAVMLFLAIISDEITF